MQKTAYLDLARSVPYVLTAYGKLFQDHFPTLFSAFAYTATTDAVTLAQHMDDFYSTNEPGPAFTMDSIACLDPGWLICWYNPGTDRYDLTCSPKRQLAVLKPATNTLLVFYLMLYLWLSKATCRPILMTEYAGEDQLGELLWQSDRVW